MRMRFRSQRRESVADERRSVAAVVKTKDHVVVDRLGNADDETISHAPASARREST
jgi:hypothetical protein